MKKELSLSVQKYLFFNLSKTNSFFQVKELKIACDVVSQPYVAEARNFH